MFKFSIIDSLTHWILFIMEKAPPFVDFAGELFTEQNDLKKGIAAQKAMNFKGRG